MDCSPPGPSVQEILRTRILEWVAIPFSRGSSQSRDETSLLHCRQFLYHLSKQRNPIKYNNTQYNISLNCAGPLICKILFNKYYISTTRIFVVDWICKCGTPALDDEGANWKHWASLVAQIVKNLPTVQETQLQSLGGEDPLEQGMATHSSTLAWRIPWTEDPGGLQSMGL